MTDGSRRKKRFGRLPALGLAVLAAFGAAPGGPDAAPLRVLDLQGSPYEIGVEHGRALKAEITELVGRWKADLEKTHRMPADEFIKRFLALTSFKPAIERWTPGLLDEVRGIADGAGLDFDTAFAFQLIDEMWVLGADVAASKCTSLAAGPRGGAPAFVSQTMDIPGFYHGFQTVLRIRDRDRGLETLVLTAPGVVALNGLNSRSVGVCVNAVTQLAHSAEGLPVAFTIRGLLRKGTFEEAAAFLREIRPAAPQNYLIGGPAQVASFEKSARKTVPFLPFEGAEFTYHTNHPLANDDFDPRFAALLERPGWSWERVKAACPRFAFLGRTLPDNAAVLDLAAIKGVYGNRASGINNAQTYGCAIMLLGKRPVLHLAPGRPDEAPYRVLDFSPGPEN